MPNFKTYHDQLPDGWFASPQDHAESLVAELARELPTGHLLDGVAVSVVAHRDGTDDILCWHHNDLARFTVIHLSWLGRTEINSQHPTVECDGSFDDFLEYERAFLGHRDG